MADNTTGAAAADLSSTCPTCGQKMQEQLSHKNPSAQTFEQQSYLINKYGAKR